MQIQKPSDLARILKTRRQAKGLTQQKVADDVGITRQSLARIERGHGGVSFDTVLRIFETLDIRLETATSNQRNLTSPIFDDGGVQRSVSDALIASQDIDTSALAAAAAAATRNLDTIALLSEWRTSLNELTAQVQETAARTGSAIDPIEARKALLSAAIEAGDPDREGSTAGGELRLRETSDGAGDG
ncbi:hypothetical protein BH10ACT5_BH10ACT5_05400 [soil metagenome]